MSHPRRIALNAVALCALLAGCLEGGTRVGFTDVDDDDVVDDTVVQIDTATPDTDDLDTTPPPIDTADPDGDVMVDTAVDTDTAAGECVPGARRCLGNIVEECDDDARWRAVEACGAAALCVNGICGCQPLCDGRACGDDGCGGSCGECAANEACLGSQCVCQPQCAGVECGPDGCGGVCGTCAPGDACNGLGQCQCVSQCNGRECGDDSCGGSCGTCADNEICSFGACECVPDCDGKECGFDGCGGTCGQCPQGQQCDPLQQCFTPPPVYRGVYVEDRWSNNCNTSGTPGADIDGVGLFDAAGNLIGHYAQNLRSSIGDTECGNNDDDPDAAIGAPDGTSVSLEGGWLLGRFGQGVTIEAGMTVTVYEFDDAAGGTADPYAVYLATNPNCGNNPNKYTTCLFLLNDLLFGTQSTVVPSSAF